MKHILYLSKGREAGGSQRQLLHLLRSLDRDLYAITVACSEDGPFIDELTELDIPTTILPMRPWRKARHLVARRADLQRLLAFVAGQPFDLVHNSYLWYGAYAARLAGALGVPLVAHVRCPVSARDITKHALTRATALIAISRRIERQLLSARIESPRVTCIEDAVDTDRFTCHPDPTIATLCNSVHAGLVFGMVGRICPEKRQLAFLEAARQLTAQGLDAQFILIGSVGSKSYLGDVLDFIHKHNLRSRALLTDRCENMPEMLSSLDVLVSLSGGSVMYEAMACERTVISAGFTRPEDAVHLQDGKTGILISTKETAPLVSAMATVASDETLRKRLGTSAREWIVQHLSVQALADKTRAVYAGLLGESPSPDA